MDTYLAIKEQIDALPGTDKIHFMNERAKRNNKLLGKLNTETHLSQQGHAAEPAGYSPDQPPGSRQKTGTELQSDSLNTTPLCLYNFT